MKPCALPVRRMNIQTEPLPSNRPYGAHSAELLLSQADSVGEFIRIIGPYFDLPRFK